jgi:hypothetical protein
MCSQPIVFAWLMFIQGNQIDYAYHNEGNKHRYNLLASYFRLA